MSSVFDTPLVYSSHRIVRKSAQSARERAIRSLDAVAFPFLFLATSYQILCAGQDVTFLNQHVLKMDDAYYYFQTARNIADLGWLTFDGIHATSGVQVLWSAVLAGLALIVHDRVGFIRAVLVLSALLNGIAGLILWRLGRNVYSGAVGSIAVILWSGFMLGLLPMMMGVEYPLQMVILPAILSVWWTIHTDPASTATRSRLQLLGVLLTLNYWNRLDSASLSLLVAVATIVSLFRTHRSLPKLARQMAWLFVWPVAGAVGYVAICMRAAHTLVPISGLVKGYYAGRHFDGEGWLVSVAGHVSWWVLIEVRPLADVVSGALLANNAPLWQPLPLAVVAVVGGATAVSAARIAGERQQDRRRFRAMVFLGLLWLFGAVHAAVVVGAIGHFSHVTQHYYAWLLITWCLWGGVMIERLLSDRSATSRIRPITIGLIASIIVGNSAVAWRQFSRPVDVNVELHNRRLAVIAWLAEHLPADARIGAWNAGQIGYFSQQTVVNLDGLANDADYLEVLRHGSLAAYLRRERITYLVDNNAIDLTMPYHAMWDHDRFFHRTVPWSSLEKVYVEAVQRDPIMVLRVRNEPTMDGDDQRQIP
jgi:hypothetical protein